MSSTSLSARLQQSAQAAAQVLEAERDALQGIEHCRQQMQQLAADSHALAQRVRRRADERIEHFCQRLQADARLQEERIASEMARLAKLAESDAVVFVPLDQAIARTIEEIVGAAQSS